MTKKDSKYYKTLRKQKAIVDRLQLGEISAKCKLKKVIVADISPSIVPPAAVFVHESVPVSPAAIPLFAIGSLISIIPDTSQRGYKSIRVIGKIISVNQSEDGIYLYDVH